MNTLQIFDELTKKYPGKNIIKNDIEDPTEIVCEIKPTEDHPKYSLAIAIIDQSIPHYHHKSTEEYTVKRGELRMHIGDKTVLLYEGQTIVIPPKQIHWAEGNETWVECFSQPGWTTEDHILVPKKRD